MTETLQLFQISATLTGIGINAWFAYHLYRLSVKKEVSKTLREKREEAAEHANQVAFLISEFSNGTYLDATWGIKPPKADFQHFQNMRKEAAIHFGKLIYILQCYLSFEHSELLENAKKCYANWMFQTQSVEYCLRKGEKHNEEESEDCFLLLNDAIQDILTEIIEIISSQPETRSLFFAKASASIGLWIKIAHRQSRTYISSFMENARRAATAIVKSQAIISKIARKTRRSLNVKLRNWRFHI